MPKHPASQLGIVIAFWIVVLRLPAIWASAVGAGFLTLAMIVPSASSRDPWRRVAFLATTAFAMLVVINVLASADAGLSQQSFASVWRALPNFLAMFGSMLWLVKRIRKDDLYPALLTSHVPSTVIFVLFRAWSFIPQVERNLHDALLSQRLRGVRIHSTGERARALTRATTGVLSAVLTDMAESSAALRSKGILLSGRKSAAFSPAWTRADSLTLAVSAFACIFAIVTF